VVRSKFLKERKCGFLVVSSFVNMDLKEIFFSVFSVSKKYNVTTSGDTISISSNFATLKLNIDYREERLNVYIHKVSSSEDFLNVEIIYRDLNILPYFFDDLTEAHVKNYFLYHKYVFTFLMEKWFTGDFQRWDYYMRLMNQQQGCSNIYELPETKSIELSPLLKELKLSKEGYLLSLISNEYLDLRWNKIYYNYGMYENVYSISCEEQGFFLEVRNRTFSSIINVFLVSKNDDYGKVDLNLIISSVGDLKEEVVSMINDFDNEKVKLDVFLKATNFALLKNPMKYYNSAKRRRTQLLNKYV